MSKDFAKVEAASGQARFGCQTFFGYFTQVWAGPLRLNIFHKEDPGAAMHNHAWDFCSIPLVSYVEEYLDEETQTLKHRVVKRFRFNRCEAEHTHRYLGKWSGKGFEVMPGRAFTLCYTAPPRRSWSYVRVHKGKVRRFPWQPYLRRILNRPRLDHI